MDTKKRLNHIIELLRQRGNRLTPQRVAILTAIIESDAHPTVEQIHNSILREFPTTSLATVYKTIKLLKDIGEILELGFGDDGNRYDGRRPKPHPHMVCTKCGAIADSEIEDLDNLINDLADKSGFTVHSHRFDIFGLCNNCNK